MKLTGTYRKGIVSLLKKNEVEADTVDVEAEWDSTLTYGENKTHFIELLKKLGKWHEQEAQVSAEVKEQIESYVKEQIEFEQQQYRQELEAEIERIRKTAVDTTEFYGTLKQKIEMVRQDYIHSLFVVGDSGCGKTTFITSQFNDGTLVKQTGHISPLQLYSVLYHNREGKIIYFDDTESLLGNEDAKVLIKQATDTTETRIVMWNTSRKLDNMPNWFVLDSNIIFALNSISQDESMKAVINRAEKVELNFCWDDYIKIMYSIAKKARQVLGTSITPQERQKIVDFIRENSDEATESFSLRSQFKVENYYVFDRRNWQKYALELLSKKVDELRVMKDLVVSGKTVKEQVKMFFDLTGKSRATYFNLKKKLKSKA